MPGSLAHLTRRFFDFLAAEPLTAEQEGRVRSCLTDAEQVLFFAQDPKDQAHGFDAGQVVADSGITENHVIQAAILHDVGKRHAGLGALGRALASVLIRLRLPLTERMRSYRDHGPIGADELTQAGSAALVVHFTRHHHGRRPDSIEPHIWEILQRADQPVKPSVRG